MRARYSSTLLGVARTRPPGTRRWGSTAPSGRRPASTRDFSSRNSARLVCMAPLSVFIATTPTSCCLAFSRMCPKVRPHAEVVGEHHHVEAAGVDGGVGDLLEVRRVRADAEEAHLALLLQPVERLVDVGRHQALDAIAGVDVDEVDVVGLQALEARLHRLDDLRHRRVVGQVAVGDAELGGDEHLVAVALHRLAEDVLGVACRSSRARCRSR